MPTKPVRQLPMRFDAETVELSQEAIAEARRLLVELLLLVIRDQTQEEEGARNE